MYYKNDSPDYDYSIIIATRNIFFRSVLASNYPRYQDIVITTRSKLFLFTFSSAVDFTCISRLYVMKRVSEISL